MAVSFTSLAEADNATTIIVQEKVANGIFTPNAPPDVSYQDEKIKLISTYNVDGSITINAEDLVLRKKFNVRLPDELAQLNELRPIGDEKIVAVGLLNSVVSIITIIDHKTRMIVDKFYGYSPEISPDGHWIAFQEFFPPHGYNDISSCYRVYNSSATAIENRVGHNDIFDPQVVGTSIYPVRFNSQLAECGVTNDEGEFIRISDSFTWGRSSDYFLFAVGEANMLNIILVKLDRKNNNWETFVYDLNKDKNICSQSECNLARVKSLNLKNGLVKFKILPTNKGEKPIDMLISIDKFSLAQ